jgi:ferrous-iron efflux pump FieF
MNSRLGLDALLRPGGALRADAALRRQASTAVLVAAILMIVVKIWGWMATGSVALLTSAADAMVDLLAAMTTYAGVRFAQQPVDSDHRFGHGKGEALAAFAQAVLLAGTAVVLAAQSVWRLIYPERLAAINLGLWIAAGGLAISGLLVAMQTYVVRRTGSAAIAADRAHYATDVLMNAAVLAAFVLADTYGWLRSDPAIALVIALYMIRTARGVAVEASRQLLDHELPSEQSARIRDVVLATAGVRGIHDLRTRDAGDRLFVEFHLEVAADASVRDGHDIVDAAERAVAAMFAKETEVIGHLEPEGIADPRLDERVRRGAK